MSASSHRPVYSVRRSPQADALTTAAGCQVARKPLRQFQVVNHDRIAIIRAMAAGKRRRYDFGERGAAIGRVGHTRVVIAIVVVVINDDGVVTRFGAVPYIAFALRAIAARGAATVADDNVGGRRLVATNLIA